MIAFSSHFLSSFYPPPTLWFHLFLFSLYLLVVQCDYLSSVEYVFSTSASQFVIFLSWVPFLSWPSLHLLNPFPLRKIYLCTSYFLSFVFLFTIFLLGVSHFREAMHCSSMCIWFISQYYYLRVHPFPYKWIKVIFLYSRVVYIVLIHLSAVKRFFLYHII